VDVPVYVRELAGADPVVLPLQAGRLDVPGDRLGGEQRLKRRLVQIALVKGDLLG
jgi:hypothetical protein